ncbi:MAG: ABC transporter permease subunit [Bacteroidales bacterium]|jgi:NitT/TauT family transport system permease protein|nr:ABC transporter permease subunit [Bacteroidales bacterium]
MKISITKNKIYTSISIILMILIWKLLSVYLASNFILPSPEDTVIAFANIILAKDFLITISTTILRGLIGFSISIILGIMFGVFSGLSNSFYSFFRPLLITIRSTPVISLILLALIWFNVSSVPIFIAFLTMFPVICTNVTDGIRNTDKDLVEMAYVYKIRKYRIVSEIYLPSIVPYVFSGASSALGFGWRAVIIGEVLSQPHYGIGTLMQTAQTFLIVKDVIAWTIIAIIISYIFEFGIRYLEKIYTKP